jgi:hypothetical protein
VYYTRLPAARNNLDYFLNYFSNHYRSTYVPSMHSILNSSALRSMALKSVRDIA